MRYVLLLVAALAALPGAATAQAPPPSGCGDLSDAQDQLETVAPIFTDDENEELRAAVHVERVSPDSPRYVVQEQRVCARLYPLILSQLRTRADWSELQRKGFTYVVLRIGGYYAVLVDNVPPAGAMVLGHSEMVIFRSDTYGYGGTVIV